MQEQRIFFNIVLYLGIKYLTLNQKTTRIKKIEKLEFS